MSGGVKDPKRVTSGKKSRTKGKVGEREVVNLFKAEGYEAERGWQARGGGEQKDVNGVPGIHVEVKRTEAFEPYAWLAQAQKEAGEGELPVVIHRRNGKSWMAIMPVEFFMRLLGERKAA